MAYSHPFGDLTPIPVSGPFTSCPLSLPSPLRSEAISCSLLGEVPRDAMHRDILGWLGNWRVRLRKQPHLLDRPVGVPVEIPKLVGLRANVNPCDARRNQTAMPLRPSRKVWTPCGSKGSPPCHSGLRSRSRPVPTCESVLVSVSSRLVPEGALAGEHHGNARGVRGVNRSLVVDRAALLHDGRDAVARRQLNAVLEREE